MSRPNELAKAAREWFEARDKSELVLERSAKSKTGFVNVKLIKKKYYLVLPGAAPHLEEGPRRRRAEGSAGHVDDGARGGPISGALEEAQG